MFGGAAGRRFSGETWEWDGRQWERRATAGPSPRVGHSMAWSPRDRAVLLYGGFGESGRHRDLWRWDGAAWSLVDSAGPAFTEGLALLRAHGDTIVIVGARTPERDTATSLNRVWAWTGTRWSPVGDEGPSVRVGQGVAYDSARRRIVLFGGAREGAGASEPDVWELDGARWVRVR